MSIISKITRTLNSLFFKGSQDYWERRYANGGNSGIGSYGDFATFKAKVINEFITKNGINSAIEFGCGDGHQLALINYKNYTGVDVSQSAINRCRAIYSGDNNKSFLHLSEHSTQTAEIALSLDVLYHLTEDETYHEYLKKLFLSSTQFVIIYSTNFESATTTPILNKHVRHRKFTDWVKKYQPDWECISHTPGELPLGNKAAPFTIDFFIYKKSKLKSAHES